MKFKMAMVIAAISTSAIAETTVSGVVIPKPRKL